MNTEEGNSLKKNEIICQGSVPIGYFDEGTAILDSDFMGCEVGRKLISSGHSVFWRNGIAKLLKTQSLNEPSVRSVRIHQLKTEVDPGKKFIGYAKLHQQYGGLDIDDYSVVFDGKLGTDNLDVLYEKFNGTKLPKGYRGHKLTVSDIVELYEENCSEFWYLDLEGFLHIDIMKE